MRNMVSKIIRKGLPFIVALLAFSSCDRPFRLDLPLAVDSHKYEFASQAGEARIFFYTTEAWTISFEPADCSWASVSRTSGNGKEDVEEIMFTYKENRLLTRQVTLVIDAGGLQERVTMVQNGTMADSWGDSLTVDDLVVVKPQNP